MPIKVINNFLLDRFSQDEPAPEYLRKRPGIIRLIFAGNLGRFQNLPLLTEGIARCFTTRPELELMFLGDGEVKAELEARWGTCPQVQFAPFLPFSQASQLIAESDIGLVSLASNIYRVSYPSKVLTYLGLGIPILALVESHSALANELRSNGLGVVPMSPTPDGIAGALAALLDAKHSKRHIERWHASNGSRDIAVARWLKTLRGLAVD